MYTSIVVVEQRCRSRHSRSLLSTQHGLIPNAILLLFCCLLLLQIGFLDSGQLIQTNCDLTRHSLPLLQCYFHCVIIANQCFVCSSWEFSSILLLIYSTPPHFKVGPLSKCLLLTLVCTCITTFCDTRDFAGCTPLE